ncbi:MAG: hypothetical protein JKX71_13840 [Amylibacter sp.]|nr:hypothetical protein [Amylibacter sp.]
MTLADLDAALLQAHADYDLDRLVTLYQKAGLSCIDANDVDAGCFYLTHAYIFALEAGTSKAREIHKVLVSYGREE